MGINRDLRRHRNPQQHKEWEAFAQDKSEPFSLSIEYNRTEITDYESDLQLQWWSRKKERERNLRHALVNDVAWQLINFHENM